ncbi:hypothetical protein BU17DRAFT_102985 [Hysterangium stoloniferum]|nr:hypothetical protein BU17DRAFT_102985 [Hysterangium stoloniferum]
MGVKQAALFWESQVKTLEKEVEQLRSTVFLLEEQSQAAEAREEMEEWKERVRNMGEDMTILRLEVMEWEDKEMARRKREKAEEEMSRKAAEEIRMKSLNSREKLREHFYEVGHI